MKQELELISRNPLVEAKWLNTLSLLEYVGSRKISKTVCQTHPTLAILEHFADETRHAFAFKKLSVQLGNSENHYLCQEAGLNYFQKLDHTISNWVSSLCGASDTYANYLFVTYMIERRAMKLYPLYKTVTQNSAVRDELQKIVLEETNHMHDIETKAKSLLKQHAKGDFEECQVVENRLFDEFFSAIRKELM